MALPNPASPNTVPIRMSIRTKLYIFVTLVVVASTTVMSWIGFQFARESLTGQIHERLDTVAHDRGARIQAYVTQQKERVALVASRTRLRRYLEEGDSDPNFYDGSQNILRDACDSTAEFLAIWITNTRGVVVTTTDDQLVKKDFSQHPDFINGQAKGHLGTPFKAGDTYHAYLTAPATTNEGELLGVVMVLLDVTGLRQVLADDTGLGFTGEVLVGAREGEMIHYLLPSPRQPNNVDVAADRAQPMRRAIEDRTTGREIGEYNGRKVLVAWRPIPYQSRDVRRWGMVVKIDQSEAYIPISNLRRLQWTTALMLVATGIVVALWLARRLTRPILKIAESATTIAKGDMSVRAPVLTTDEIGQLASAFNSMTDEVAQSHRRLEDRVNIRTQELADANEALTQSNAELQQFAYVASHDLKEPLRAVSSFSELLRDRYKGQMDAKADQFIEFIVDGADRMRSLIDDLLRFSRVATHGEEFESESVRAVVDAALANLSTAIDESGVTIHVDELPVVMCDKSQLVRVFQNLLANAIKFRGENPPVIKIHAHETEEHWQFSVVDNGIGIDPQFAERVFVIFQRLHTRTKFPGTGIGLAICQRIVQRHGGKIWVEPNESDGSSFHFTIRKDRDVKTAERE